MLDNIRWTKKQKAIVCKIDILIQQLNDSADIRGGASVRDYDPVNCDLRLVRAMTGDRRGS